jgi:hypothetical protein
MRRQERETMGHNEYSGARLYSGGRRRGDNSFPKEMIISVSTIRTIRTRIQRLRELEVQFFLSRGILKKELRFTGCTSHQADQHGHLPEVNVEIPEQMLDQIINSSARSVVTEKIGFNQQLTEDLI